MATAKKTPTTKPESNGRVPASLEPHRLEVNVIAAIKNADGVVVGEQAVAQMVVYPLDFNTIGQQIHDRWAEIEAQFFNGSR